MSVMTRMPNFGTGGPRDDNNTCGIDAREVQIKAMGYILVQ